MNSRQGARVALGVRPLTDDVHLVRSCRASEQIPILLTGLGVDESVTRTAL